MELVGRLVVNIALQISRMILSCMTHYMLKICVYSVSLGGCIDAALSTAVILRVVHLHRFYCSAAHSRCGVFHLISHFICGTCKY
jgi:hypothetical protein